MSSRIQNAFIEKVDLMPADKKRCDEQDMTRKEELSRMMYERIAQGNRLAEVEEVARQNARHK